jgi:hypothetical protein
MICAHASDFEVIPRREGGRIVDFDVRTFCKGCGQRDCACPDPVYAGICPPLNDAGRGSVSAPASAPARSFHDMGDSRG